MNEDEKIGIARLQEQVRGLSDTLRDLKETNSRHFDDMKRALEKHADEDDRRFDARRSELSNHDLENKESFKVIDGRLKSMENWKYSMGAGVAIGVFLTTVALGLLSVFWRPSANVMVERTVTQTETQTPVKPTPDPGKKQTE